MGLSTVLRFPLMRMYKELARCCDPCFPTGILVFYTLIVNYVIALLHHEPHLKRVTGACRSGFPVENVRQSGGVNPWTHYSL
jgi:hypothetical protein